MKIAASECANCSTTIIPPRKICPKCGPSDEPMHMVDLAPSGILESYTVSRFPPTGFEPPLVLGLIKLEHNALVLALSDPEVIDSLAVGIGVTVSTDSKGRMKFTSRP